jgi:ATP-dependent exoDNAse (exonuclease V) beta subunit
LEVPKVGNKGTQGNWGKERLAALRESSKALAEDLTQALAPFKDAVVHNLAHWVAGALLEWDHQKARGGFLDFDDLLLKTRDLLRDHPEAREELKGRLEHLFVDEFQDTDPLQVEIVFFLCEATGRKEKGTLTLPSPLVGEGRVRGAGGTSISHEKDWRKVRLEPGKLFLVGDPKQSIYRFRRADVAIYEQTKERVLQNGGKVEVLSENFRTVGGLVEWVNSRFPARFQGTGIDYRPLNANRKKGETEGTLPILWGLRIEPPKDFEPSKANFRRLEAQRVAAYLREQVLGGGHTVSDPDTHELRPVRPGDIALLFRDLSNENEEAWEEALRELDLPYQIVGGKRFYNRPEIVALSTLLTCLSSPVDEAAAVATLRGPLFGFTDEELFLHRAGGGDFRFQTVASGKMGEAFSRLREWFQATRTLGVSDTLTELYRRTNLLAVTAGQPHGEQRVANLMKVLDQARELEVSQHFTWRAFTKWLTTQQEEETLEGEAPGPDASGDRLTLMTIHKAKGLEFPVVFLSAWAADPKETGSLVDRRHSVGAFKVGKEDLGLRTLNYEEVKAGEAQQRQAEDTRLLYVAATRARDCLLLPHYEMSEGSKFTNEGLFSGPLLTALEQKDAPVFWVGLKEEAGPLEDPPAWVVPLEGQAGAALEAERKKWKAQVQEREKRIQALLGEREFRSVTSVLGVAEEKREREERAFEEGESTSPWGGKGLGVLTHFLLEKGWDRDERSLEKAAAQYAQKAGIPPEQEALALKWAKETLGSPLLQRAKFSGKVFRELPLTGRQADGAYLNAVLDLAFLEKDGWVIVDYKTDQDTERLASKYREQLGHYAKLLEKVTGRNVKEAHLFFVRHDKVEKVPL